MLDQIAFYLFFAAPRKRLWEYFWEYFERAEHDDDDDVPRVRSFHHDGDFELRLRSRSPWVGWMTAIQPFNARIPMLMAISVVDYKVALRVLTVTLAMWLNSTNDSGDRYATAKLALYYQPRCCIKKVMLHF